MTDLEISKALAVAIGWGAKDCLSEIHDGVFYVQRWPIATTPGMRWSRFDYRDPAVIWPIAEKFDCFPFASLGGWAAPMPGQYSDYEYTDTAAKAVALAVIGGEK